MAIRVLRHESEVLRDNACGDPSVRDLWVYTPPTSDLWVRSGESSLRATG